MVNSKILVFSILSISILFNSCKTDIPNRSDAAFKAHFQPTFSDVRKAISTKDGASVFIGMDEGVPSVLILNADFSLRFFQRYSDYGPGCFHNVCEMSNGDIAMVGYTQSRDLYASPINSNPIMVRISRNGAYQRLFTDTTDHNHDQFTAIAPLEGEGLLVSSFHSPYITTYQLDANSNVLDQFTWGFNKEDDKYAYLSAITSETTNASYFCVGNRNIPSSLNTYIPFSYSTLSGKLAPNPVTNKSYENYSRADWTRNAPLRPIRGEIATTEISGQFYYGTTGYSDGKFSILLLHMNDFGGINGEKKYFGNGQAAFQNMVKFSKGYLLMGSTIDVSNSFNSNNYDFYILAIDNDGNTLWEDTIVTNNKAESALTAFEKNGTISIAGYSIDDHNLSSFFQVLYDQNGSKLN